MRIFISTLVTTLLLVGISGCGEPERAPGLSQSTGTNSSNRLQPSKQNNKKKPAKKPLDLSQFESFEDKKKDPSGKEPPISMKLQPIEPAPTEVAKTKEGDPKETEPKETTPMSKTELGEVERAAIESLTARGANIRVIDGHAFSLLVKEENKINDTDCPDIAKLTKLQFLGLSGAKITNAGLERIASLKEVTSIILNKTLISDEGAAELEKMPKLAHVDISETAVTPEGKILLEVAFPSALITRNELLAKTEGTMKGEDPKEEPAELPVFPEGSASEAIQKISLTLAAGKTEGLDQYISEDADRLLDTIRENNVTETRLLYYQKVFDGVKALSKPRQGKKSWSIILTNEDEQHLHFTCRKEGDVWKASRFAIETPREK